MIDSDAFLDKPIGDEIVALYFPLWGADHAAKGLRAAQNLLIGTGHADVGGPWIPIGVGLHTGVAFVGTVGVEGTDSYDVTALGDAVNVTSRLASLARTGEILVSDDVHLAASLDLGDLDRRTLELKGRSEPLGVRVLTVATAQGLSR